METNYKIKRFSRLIQITYTISQESIKTKMTRNSFGTYQIFRQPLRRRKKLLTLLEEGVSATSMTLVMSLRSNLKPLQTWMNSCNNTISIVTSCLNRKRKNRIIQWICTIITYTINFSRFIYSTNKTNKIKETFRCFKI